MTTPGLDQPLTEAILESISDGVFTVSDDWVITSFNRSAELITGISRADAIGRRCAEVFRSNMCEQACALEETIQSGKPVVCRAGWIVSAVGTRIPVSVSTAVLRDAKGRVIGGAETFRDLSEVETLRQELAGKSRVGDLESRSPSMRRLFDVLPAVAASPSTVLLEGETGTGKERFARVIHALSPRANEPFIAVNCGALPEGLLESELFGYKAGAFTGANRDKPGRFALARGGTLFLDEIGEIPLAVQVKLLRVLQERRYEPLGAVNDELADVRVIVATHRDLKAQVAQGAFREDLYYRINVMRLELPPLHQRREDIPLLIDQFIERFNCLQNRSLNGITPAALAVLIAHDWPGNIRELENVIERAFILCTAGEIDLLHLPVELSSRQRADTIQPADIRSVRRTLDVRTLQDALERNRFHREKTARELGIHKTTLYRMMKKLGILPPRSASDR